MKNELYLVWFAEPNRDSLNKFINNQLIETSSRLTDLSVYSDDMDSTCYKLSALGAWVTVLNLIKYTCVDQTIKRPWVAHKRVTKSLESKEFKEYISEVIKRLTAQPPNTNYSVLVHIQSVISFLTTMEIIDGRPNRT